MPAPHRIGRPRSTDLRDFLDAVLYMAKTGCQWRMLPKNFPHVSTVQPRPSSTTGAMPLTHVADAVQRSVPLQNRPSLQSASPAHSGAIVVDVVLVDVVDVVLVVVGSGSVVVGG